MTQKKEKKEVKLNKFDADGNPIPEKFQNPKKLGFLRFLMICYGIVPFILLFGCLFISKDQLRINAFVMNAIVEGLVFAVIF